MKIQDKMIPEQFQGVYQAMGERVSRLLGLSRQYAASGCEPGRSASALLKGARQEIEDYKKAKRDAGFEDCSETGDLESGIEELGRTLGEK